MNHLKAFLLNGAENFHPQTEVNLLAGLRRGEIGRMLRAILGCSTVPNLLNTASTDLESADKNNFK